MKAYMIKFAFVDSKPLIWRRIVLPANGTFYRLHQIIQTATNFKSVYEPYHTYQFQMGQVYVVDNRMREEALLESGGEIHLARRTKFDDYFEKHQEMRYTYDFGDNWQIDIRLEKVVDDYHFGYPTILAGEHNAPPEDVGGLSGFADFIKSYENPSHPDYLNALQWAEGRGYRPFSMEDINDKFKDLKYQKTDWTKIHHENYKIISDSYRPPDIVNTKEIDDKELIAHYAIAAANLYGALTLEKFAEIYNAHNESAWSVTQLKSVLNAPLYRKVLKNGYTYLRYDWIMEESVEEFGYLLELIEMTEGKPYYIPAKKEFLRYTDHFYFEKTKAVAALTKILADDFYGGSSLMAYEDVEDVVLNCNLFNHDIHDVIQSFLFRHEVESEGQMKKYVAAIINVANHVRLWENRGHTPSELSAMERAHLKPIAEPAFTVVQGGKIGRNDPCPCGSGKKYKKCCGK